MGSKPKRILFVCTANMDRSPTAETLLKNFREFEVKSAGIWPNARRRLTREMIEWADIIFVMEDHHKDAVLTLNHCAEDKVIVLNIPDIYVRNDPKLVSILKTKLTEYLGINWDKSFL